MRSSDKNEDAICLDLDNLAPISISVYTRINHFRECIESLKKNALARHSVLYVFSDAARPGDEISVDTVRAYAESIGGFREVRLYFQKHNNMHLNMQKAREIPIQAHGTIIRMEDDNVMSSSFLSYMNEALVLYEDNPRVLGISGYSPPINQEKHISDEVYLSHFWSAWTYAAWLKKDISKYLEFKMPYADMLANNLTNSVKKLHPKLHHALKRMDEGTHKAGDQKISYYMIKYGLYQIKPVYSLVKNTGHDGSGVHCGQSDRFNVDPYPGKIDVHLGNFRYYPSLDKLQYKFFYKNSSIVKRLRRKFMRIFNEKFNL